MAATAVALAATFALRQYGPAPSFLFFVPAIAIAAWYGGRGPSTVATALSLLLIDLNFFAPGGDLSLDRVLGIQDTGPEWAFGALALGAAASALTVELGRRSADKATGGSPATPPVTAGDPVTAD